MCGVDEMINLTFTPFARIIQRIKERCVSIRFPLEFVGREVVLFPATYCVINYIDITYINIYFYWRSNSVI